MTRRLGLIVLLAAALAYSAGCGGNSGSAPVTALTGRAAALTITTDGILPGTLQGRPYTTTLSAINGQGALHWSISPVGSTVPGVNGLTLDPNTGVLSGTANFLGTGAFIAQVTDSASPPQSTSKSFTVTAYSPLTANPSGSAPLLQFDPASVPAVLGFQGGVPPLIFEVGAGTLPRGLKLDHTTGIITGAALDLGTFTFTLVVQDSLTPPPETVNQQFTITVTPHTLEVAPSLPSRILLSRPFTGRVVATGGIPPYSFAVGVGTALPPGIALDPVTGAVTGTPTTAGTYSFLIEAHDSSTPANTAGSFFLVTVATPLGRNDSPATATPVTNGVAASISPYIDPPNGVPAAADSDFYKIVSLGGATVHVQTVARVNFPNDPVDTVIQITDANGRQLSSCRQPGDTSTNFTSPCVNDDVSATLKDSALDFLVPGAANVAMTFYVQVLDWRGDARPDMQYGLQVSGVLPPP